MRLTTLCKLASSELLSSYLRESSINDESGNLVPLSRCSLKVEMAVFKYLFNTRPCLLTGIEVCRLSLSFRDECFDVTDACFLAIPLYTTAG